MRILQIGPDESGAGRIEPMRPATFREPGNCCYSPGRHGVTCYLVRSGARRSVGKPREVLARRCDCDFDRPTISLGHASNQRARVFRDRTGGGDHADPGPHRHAPRCPCVPDGGYLRRIHHIFGIQFADARTLALRRYVAGSRLCGWLTAAVFRRRLGGLAAGQGVIGCFPGATGIGHTTKE